MGWIDVGFNEGYWEVAILINDGEQFREMTQDEIGRALAEGAELHWCRPVEWGLSRKGQTIQPIARAGKLVAGFSIWRPHERHQATYSERIHLCRAWRRNGRDCVDAP